MHYPNFGEMAAHLACKFNAAAFRNCGDGRRKSSSQSLLSASADCEDERGQNHFRFLLHAQN